MIVVGDSSVAGSILTTLSVAGSRQSGPWSDSDLPLIFFALSSPPPLLILVNIA
jgi:hypothetical protein